jgi:hypothetical protein
MILLVAVSASEARASNTQACDAAYEKAQALRDAKKLLASREPLRACANAACPGFMVKDCTAWLSDVETRIPSVVVVASDQTGAPLPNVALTIDGAPSPLDGTSVELEPGRHMFSFIALDGRKIDKPFVVIEGAKDQRVTVTFATPATPAPLSPVAVPPAQPATTDRTRRVLGLTLGGVGIAGVVTGAIFGGFTFSSWSSVKSSCPTLVDCPAQAGTDHSNAVTFGTVSDIGFIAGGVLLVTGLTLYLTAPKQPSAVGVELGPGSVGLGGRF